MEYLLDFFLNIKAFKKSQKGTINRNKMAKSDCSTILDSS